MPDTSIFRQTLPIMTDNLENVDISGHETVYPGALKVIENVRRLQGKPFASYVCVAVFAVKLFLFNPVVI